MKNIDDNVLAMKISRARAAKIAVCAWKDREPRPSPSNTLPTALLGFFELIPETAKDATNPIKAIPNKSRKLKNI
jgi:hypothetical protein